MPQYPIPNDWDGETWGCVLIEWPDSEQWLGMLRGLVTSPVRGRFWDGATGSIIDAQNIGLDILGRNQVVTCQAIVVALNAINQTLADMDVNVSNQVTIQTAIANNVDLVATALATSFADQTLELVAASGASASAVSSSYAWSQAFASSMVGVEVINNFPAQFRSCEPGVTTPPAAEEETPTSITNVLESTVPADVCRRAYWLVAGGREFTRYLYEAALWYDGTILVMAGAVADAFWGIAALSSPTAKRYLMPASVLVTLGHNLNALKVKLLLIPMLEDLKEYVEDNFNSLVCQIAQAMIAIDSTEDIQTMIVNDFFMYYPTADPLIAGVLKSWFNLSSLGALYYVSTDLDIAPVLPPGTPPDICDYCAE